MKSNFDLHASRRSEQTQRLADKRPFETYVVRVCDGDTICVARDWDGVSFNGVEYIRIAFVDAPELKGPNKLFAEWSRSALAGLLIGQVVTVRPRRIWRDLYHRIIGSVTLGDLDVGTWLIQNGHARERRYTTRKSRAYHSEITCPSPPGPSHP